MTERLWGHDGVRIEVPYSVCKVIADRDHPHRQEVLNALSEKLTELLASSNPLQPSPIATVIEGVLLDGGDMSMGPVAYIRKVFMSDVEHAYEMLRDEIETRES